MQIITDCPGIDGIPSITLDWESLVKFPVWVTTLSICIPKLNKGGPLKELSETVVLYQVAEGSEWPANLVNLVTKIIH